MDHGNQNFDISACQELSNQATFSFTADYGFEYSDDEAQEEDVDIENQYYNSKGDLHSLYILLILLSNNGRSSKGTERGYPTRSAFLNGSQATNNIALQG